MPEYVNSGILFTNHRKREARHPSHQGNATVQCPNCQHSTKFDLAAWEKNGAKGPFWSVAFKLPKPPEGEQPAPQTAPAPDGDPQLVAAGENRIPF